MTFRRHAKFLPLQLPHWAVAVVAVATVGCVILVASALLAFWRTNAEKAEIALLETENTARRVNLALLAPEIWKPTQGTAKSLLIPRTEAPPVALWSLSRWPTGTEIFVAVRGKTPFLVRSPKPDTLEFVPTDARAFFTRAVGELKNVEWFFADKVNTGETALVSVESGEARERAYKKYHWATVSIPGTNTVLRRYFVFDAWAILQEPLLYSFAVALSLASGLFWYIGRNFSKFGMSIPSQKQRHEDANVTSTLRDAPYFVRRALACFSSELVETQCIVVLAADNLQDMGMDAVTTKGEAPRSESPRQRDRIVEAISQSLAEICKHGPLPVLLQRGGTEPTAQALWGIHCPHFDKKKALSFAESCRTKLEANPELTLRSPSVTMSTAVAEFRKDSSATFDAESLLKNLLTSTIAALQRTQELGGAQTVFAESIFVGTKEASS
jgi:hypothetical protein